MNFVPLPREAQSLCKSPGEAAAGGCRHCREVLAGRLVWQYDEAAGWVLRPRSQINS